MRRASVAVVAGLLLGGCTLTTPTIPSWVPWLGSRDQKAAKAATEKTESPKMAAKSDRKQTRGKVQAEPGKDAADSEAKPRVQDDTISDRIVAVVNNDAITLAELQENVAHYRQENKDETRTTDEELARQFLTRLIDARVQLQEADREKITIEEAELEEELAERAKKAGVATMAELDQTLRAQGLSLETVKQRLRETLKIAKVIRRKVASRVSITDGEIDRYLEDNRAKLEAGLAYHARHILIVPDAPKDDAAWEAARIRAEMLRTQILEGADFAELARQHSQDASAKDGGDLGTLRRGELTQDIEAQILALEPGQVSKPYRSALGYHVFRIESKEALEGEALTRARQQVREILFRQKYDARFAAWLREIKERAVIEIRM